MVGVNALTPRGRSPAHHSPAVSGHSPGTEHYRAAAVFVLFVVATVDCWWPEPGHQLDIKTNIYLSRLTSSNVVLYCCNVLLFRLPAGHHRAAQPPAAGGGGHRRAHLPGAVVLST